MFPSLAILGSWPNLNLPCGSAILTGMSDEVPKAIAKFKAFQWRQLLVVLLFLAASTFWFEGMRLSFVLLGGTFMVIWVVKYLVIRAAIKQADKQKQAGRR